MRLVWVVIPLILFSFVGIQESFTQPPANLKITDLEGNSFSNVRSGQQVIITHNVSTYYFPLQYDANCMAVNMSTNCSPEITKPYVIGDEIFQGNVDDQPFTIIFQVQNQDGVTVYLSWVEGRIHREQIKIMETMWTTQESGSYTVTAFVWSAIDYPSALSAPVSSTIRVL